jgi:glycosyl transferase family 2
VIDPPLSVICTVGPRRERAERVVQALSRQTAAEKIELILIDAAPGAGALETPDEIPARVIPARPGWMLGDAKAAALAAAQGEAVAFLADHVYPQPGWAAALISAYRDGPWAAVGYSFSNANPDTYGSRAAMLADFAPWLAVTGSGEVDYLPANDISYRRAALAGFGDQIGELLMAEPLLLDELRGRGRRLAVKGEAGVSHGCLRTMWANAAASFDFCQALAGIQRRRQRWGMGRQLAQALASALAAPPIRTVRTVRALAGKSAPGAVLLNLPGIFFQHLLAGLGQAWGYLVGGRGAAERFLEWEVAAARDDR